MCSLHILLWISLNPHVINPSCVSANGSTARVLATATYATGVHMLADREPMPVLLELVIQIPAKCTAIMSWQESDGLRGGLEECREVEWEIERQRVTILCKK